MVDSCKMHLNATKAGLGWCLILSLLLCQLLSTGAVVFGGLKAIGIALAASS